MPLSAGEELGPYEILSLLGRGGMGEAYRGRESKQGRDLFRNQREEESL
jgi:hypothetical protein